MAKFDFIQYELNDENEASGKSLLFYAIEHNDETFVKVLLEMEAPLNKSYSVSRLHRIFRQVIFIVFEINKSTLNKKKKKTRRRKLFKFKKKNALNLTYLCSLI